MKKSLMVAALLVALPTFAIAQNPSPASKSYSEMHQKMMSSMSMPMAMSGDADKDFVMMMIPHHQGAIDMARVELQHGKDPKLRAMAETIIKMQEKEIAELKAWQAANR